MAEIDTLELQTNFIRAVQDLYNIQEYNELSNLTSQFVNKLKAASDERLQILKSKFSAHFDLKCQEHFEDQKNYLQKELERRISEAESEFILRKNEMEQEFSDRESRMREEFSINIQQILDEQEKTFQSKMSSQLAAKDELHRKTLREMNDNFNIQRSKDVEAI